MEFTGGAEKEEHSSRAPCAHGVKNGSGLKRGWKPEPPEHRVINGRIRSGLNITIYCLLGRCPMLLSYSIGIAMGPIWLILAPIQDLVLVTDSVQETELAGETRPSIRRD